ncbi:digestive organ expansion factor [Laetiporus sulphureus 93-53]|uniref:U3 small nucleolar RNA-associated protein 25 n=1 Tax=Laetiporus sulphureus 93-53 TaxID=1314785 RepID=A0A165GTC5_9APHY|nr:digestive organ expansion factor [Laetiporus sulphureus 93-53]KZT10784.1 digestive organ expansion factor [Laetiporus sulphureus 93-53]
MAVEETNAMTTRLLTLLNISATKAGSRKRTFEEEENRPVQRLNKRRMVQFHDDDFVINKRRSEESVASKGPNGNGEQEMMRLEDKEKQEEDTLDNSQDPYEEHFGSKSSLVTNVAREAADRGAWMNAREKYGRLESVIVSIPEGCNVSAASRDTQKIAVLDKLREPFTARQIKLPHDIVELQDDLLAMLSSQRDLYITRAALDTHQSMREVVALHALNHITKKRRRVLKNNERLTHALKSGAPSPEDVQDQGFTRPSVLILLPFRSFAMKWIMALTTHTPSPSYQVENRSRFNAEYGLPPGAVDKLASSEPGTYPRDHVEMFKGNVDDAFRVGIKMTRKSVKLFADFYGCDLIIASPLGLRMSIEKEKSADFLSSVEVLIADQMDALTMQNWEHVQFIFSHLNQLPKESHDVDFSRIKPWYLDGHAAYLRQSILFTAYETPETRALFTGSLKNVAGKVRTERRWPPVEVPEGIDQNFVHFDCSSPKDEVDKRFQHFTTHLLPTVLKSAVQSSNTVVFIPSSFDFIRVQNHFRKNLSVTFVVLSEYSSNQDISRAREAFFSGKKAFLLISERFHFFRRYKLRGIRNIIFYGPPDHPQFYTEFLSYPFLDDGIDVSDVTCRVLYSRYDWMRLERIAGTEGATQLIRRNAL